MGMDIYEHLAFFIIVLRVLENYENPTIFLLKYLII